jgi:hypothetical protein
MSLQRHHFPHKSAPAQRELASWTGSRWIIWVKIVPDAPGGAIMPFVDIRFAVANRGLKEVRALRGDLRPG